MTKKNLILFLITCLKLSPLIEGLNDKELSDYNDNYLSERILVGKPVESGVSRGFAGIVRLLIDNETCTGSIIAEEWILTAAHCFWGIECVGRTKIFPLTSKPEFVIEPLECILHPQFSGKFEGVDLSLVKVPRFDPKVSVGRVRLIQSQTWISKNTAALIFGFGKTEYGKLPERLLRADVVVESWHECNRRRERSELETNPRWPRVDIPRTCFCTVGLGPRPSGNCYGDSGGPVIINGCLAGVFSFIVGGDGIKCQLGFPAYHVGVSFHLPWIKSYIGSGNTDGK